MPRVGPTGTTRMRSSGAVTTTRTWGVCERRARDGEHMSDDVAATEDWMVPAMILAIYQHRRRISVLLDRLDDPQRGVVEAAVSALDDGTVDPATLLAKVGQGVRDGQDRLHQLIQLLEPEPARPRIRPARPARTPGPAKTHAHRSQRHI